MSHYNDQNPDELISTTPPPHLLTAWWECVSRASTKIQEIVSASAACFINVPSAGGGLRREVGAPLH